MKAAILIMQLHSAPSALSLPNMKLKEVPATEPNNLHNHYYFHPVHYSSQAQSCTELCMGRLFKKHMIVHL